MRDDPPPPLAREVVEPSLARERSAVEEESDGDDWDGCSGRGAFSLLSELWAEASCVWAWARRALNARSSSAVKLTVVDVDRAWPAQPAISGRKN